MKKLRMAHAFKSVSAPFLYTTLVCCFTRTSVVCMCQSFPPIISRSIFRCSNVQVPHRQIFNFIFVNVEDQPGLQTGPALITKPGNFLILEAGVAQISKAPALSRPQDLKENVIRQTRPLSSIAPSLQLHSPMRK